MVQFAIFSHWNCISRNIILNNDDHNTEYRVQTTAARRNCIASQSKVGKRYGARRRSSEIYNIADIQCRTYEIYNIFLRQLISELSIVRRVSSILIRVICMCDTMIWNNEKNLFRAYTVCMHCSVWRDWPEHNFSGSGQNWWPKCGWALAPYISPICILIFRLFVPCLYQHTTS